MTLYPTGGEAATLALGYCVLSWVAGTLYGAYAWERANDNRSLRELCGFDSEEIVTDGGRETFDCDNCGDETLTSERFRYLRPDQPDEGPIQSDDLCPRCSTRKDNSRLFRSGDDLIGGDSDA
ncbi:hypothetical protein [Haloarcula amylovorans]|uniref:hypothetical protein n=1 Tax=Haloarcula amylovorans TaxID=2562280 RepID=UPI001075FABC|nr:hypothetical protein [Halomicroarcula amylolytica]